MDIRSMLSSDSNSNSQPRPPQRVQTKPESPIRQTYSPHGQPAPGPFSSPTLYYPTNRNDSRPPQPPQLRSPGQRELQSPNGDNRYQTLQSPYTSTPNSSLGTGQYPFPHPARINTSQSPKGNLFEQKEHTATITSPGGQVYGQRSPSVSTPLSATPGGTFPYPSYRPQSGHSATPTSARSYTQSLSRDRERSPSISPKTRPHPEITHKQSRSYDNPRLTESPNPSIGRSPQSFTSDHGGITQAFNRAQSEVNKTFNTHPNNSGPYNHGPGVLVQSLDSSRREEPPKFHLNQETTTTTPIRAEQNQVVKDADSHGHVRRTSENGQAHSYNQGISSGTTLNNFKSPPPPPFKPLPTDGSLSTPTRTASTSSLITSQILNSDNPMPKSRAVQVSPNPSLSSSVALASPHTSAPTIKPYRESSMTSTQRSSKGPRRQKFREIPIWARKRGTMGDQPLPNKRLQETKVVKIETNDQNGHLTPAEKPQPLPKTEAVNNVPDALGYWEPNILNMVPQDELSRIVADFLFAQVIERRDLTSIGAILEVEAKIGQIVDRSTNERLTLPVMNECIINKEDGRVRTAFKSSMTEAQHRNLNQFLNNALLQSLPKNPPVVPPRSPISYVHTRETDRFFELSQAGQMALPPLIRSELSLRHGNKAKIRITHDQKTGTECAKIIKIRLGDLDVYSPKTPFDWRISVNLEVKWDGDLRDLREVLEVGQKRPDRSKDRMTYRHQAFQIDLTQVTMVAESSTKEHELEIELDTAELRKHGELLKAGQESGYEALTRGFVDNIRVLVRALR